VIPNNLQTLLQEAQRMTANLLSEMPSDHRLKYVRDELRRIEDLLEAGWPLSESDQRRITIGLFAVRELEGFHDQLATLLEQLNYKIDHPELA
jgi:hypothetical protein